MAKKFFPRALSVGLSLALCAGMVLPSFAASFADLNKAITTGESQYNSETQQVSIEASKDEKGAVSVKLHEDVEYGGKDDEKRITIDGNDKVLLDLNGKDIDGKMETDDSVIRVDQGGELTLKDSTAHYENGDYVSGSITGGVGETFDARNVLDGETTAGGGILNYGTLTMESGAIRGNGSDKTEMAGGVFTWDKDGADADASFTMKGGVIENNTAGCGGGIDQWAGELNLLGGAVANNQAAYGGAAYVNWAKVTINDATIKENQASGSGGGVVLEGCETTVANTTFEKNTADDLGGGILLDCGGEITFGANNHFTGNTAKNAGDDIAVAEGNAVFKGSVGEWIKDSAADRTNPEQEKYEFPKDGTVVADGSNWELAAGLKYVEPVSDGGNGGGNDGNDDITLTDTEIPLAGIFTRGDAIGYLWRQAGEPEAEPSTFEDVPEDHEWAVAIGWAQDMGIARADEEGNFRPDDLVLRSVESLEVSPEGELQEFLNWYAAYAGVELDAGELFIQLEGAWDDVIMGEDAQVIFDDFFAKLEAALTQAA